MTYYEAVSECRFCLTDWTQPISEKQGHAEYVRVRCPNCNHYQQADYCRMIGKERT